MKFGVYNAILHDRSLPEAIEVIAKLGLTGIELNSGGFLPAVHIPTFDDILSSDAARDDFLGLFEGTGVEIAGLNCNGNPLHPDPVIGSKHAEDVRRSIRLANRLGQHRVVTMSGLPAGEPGGRRPNWIVNAWNSAALDVLDYQWSVAEEFWREIDREAADLDVKVALELHPQNIVFNPAGMRELVERTGATNIGVELDASHLFWQWMDPVAVAQDLGPLVFHAAAKDVRVNPAAAVYGVLDNRFRRLGPDEPRTNLGGDEWANEWPKDAAWDFVALGRGHDAVYWSTWLAALYAIDPDMLVNIEHEDVSLGRIEGLEVAAGVLLDAARRAGIAHFLSCSRIALLNPPSSSSLADEKPCRLAPPPLGGARLPTLAARFLSCSRIALLNPPARNGPVMAPLKIGILGAARIADDGIVDPSRVLGHRLVAVAARDQSRAEAFAAQRGVERVSTETYAEVIDDPEVEVVYNALVNSLHARVEPIRAECRQACASARSLLPAMGPKHPGCATSPGPRKVRSWKASTTYTTR